MAKPTGFIDYQRDEVPHRPVSQRIKDYFEIELPLPETELLLQAARCMDCGVPFCHGTGCPLHNRIPEFNDLVYRGRWKEACENLHATNNFPEITGRVCPALCEAACTLNIFNEPVMVRHIEYQIVERGFAEGWIKPLPPLRRTDKKVAIVGSGPAGLAAAQQLARAGHSVTVYEKDDHIGGLLRYGIPDFKLEKRVIDRRLEQLKAEGVEFQAGVSVGQDISSNYLRKMYDAICLAMGAGKARDLGVPGRGLDNILPAMEFLSRQNRILSGEQPPGGRDSSARGKTVVVIGGGDTGSDCVGTAIRQGAKEVHQFEILPMPPEGSNTETPWPMWPKIMRCSSSHEEGCNRRWSVLTKKFIGTGSRVGELIAADMEWFNGPRGPAFKEIQFSDFNMKVDMVLLAMGFEHVVHEGLVSQLGVKLDPRGNVAVNDFITSEEGVFAAGDTVEGASLVVRAIDSGRRAAEAIDHWLQSR